MTSDRGIARHHPLHSGAGPARLRDDLSSVYNWGNDDERHGPSHPHAGNSGEIQHSAHFTEPPALAHAGRCVGSRANDTDHRGRPPLACWASRHDRTGTKLGPQNQSQSGRHFAARYRQVAASRYQPGPVVCPTGRWRPTTTGHRRCDSCVGPRPLKPLCASRASECVGNVVSGSHSAPLRDPRVAGRSAVATVIVPNGRSRSCPLAASGVRH
jgi:hypothetical protein